MSGLVMPAGTELRTAALAAEAYLVIDSAFKYGLLEGDLGGTINIERCEELIRGRDRHPSPAGGRRVTPEQQLALRGMPRRRPFCPDRDCEVRCGVPDGPACLCRPCYCPRCARRHERACKGSASASLADSITFKASHIYLQPALFRQRPERTYS